MKKVLEWNYIDELTLVFLFEYYVKVGMIIKEGDDK